MANRRFYQFRLSLEPQVSELFAHATFGAAGAVTLDASQSRGISSITHGGAGTYTINFQDNYNRLLMFSSVFVAGTGPTSPNVRVYTDNVASSTAPSLTVVFSVGGVDTDPANGEEIRFSVVLKNSNA